MVERMRDEQAQAAEENMRLAREVEALRSQLAGTDSVTKELAALREERDIIRTRVGDMLDHLEALNL
jgi:regulator of replication initiation timing